MMLEQPVPDSLRTLPKIDLHRHLEGSLRLDTLAELTASTDINLPADITSLRAAVQIVSDDARVPQTLFNKFKALRAIYRTPEIIQRVVREAIEDAAADNVRYLELRYTPATLALEAGFALRDVFSWVAAAARAAAAENSLRVNLIVSVNRHESLHAVQEIADLALEYRDQGVVAFDLAGDESRYPADAFIDLFRSVRQAGLPLAIHAGEWSGAEAVIQAIEIFGVARIGHGVRVLESEQATELARERRIPFEVCPSSNLLSGVVDNYANHPFKEMIQRGLLVTINTDNPGIMDMTLGDEYARLLRHTDISLETLRAMNLSAVQAAFLDKQQKKLLEQELLTAFFHSDDRF